MNFAILYTLVALALAVVGFIRGEYYYYIGAILVGACAFYWIWKEWKKKG